MTFDIRVEYCCGCIPEEMESAYPHSGRCRRFPPQTDPDTTYVLFPITRGTEWCGEFKTSAASPEWKEKLT